MKVLLQRVRQAQVDVDRQTIAQIEMGLLLLVGIERHDNTALLERMAQKVTQYRLFADQQGKMNLNVKEVSGGILAVSQFTLAADTQKGLRPGFSKAAPPEQAEKLFHNFVSCLRSLHSPVEQGIFAADMQVSLINDGPVTFLLELSSLPTGV